MLSSAHAIFPSTIFTTTNTAPRAESKKNPERGFSFSRDTQAIKLPYTRQGFERRVVYDSFCGESCCPIGVEKFLHYLLYFMDGFKK